jgi:hypothetical protein
MFDLEVFKTFIDELARLNGLSEDEASDIAAAIGDTPEIDEQGRAVVHGRAYLIPLSED